MRKSSPLVMAAALLFAGCSDGPPDLTKTGPKPAHGGELVLLPDKAGYVEVVKGDGKGPEASFYLLTPDNTPFTPSSGGGTFVAGKNQIPLKVEGGGLVMPPGNSTFGSNAVSGELKIGHDGKTLVVPIGIR